MKKNVGNIDRIIRIVVGVALLAWGLSTQNWLGLIGVVPLMTGLIRWCPAYCPLGISTGCGSNACCGGDKCGS